eukprot:GHRQ01023673.1.p1 GENE.GHRQ01023673.1~~GHRQ01023673.1.p1  ORF type:complete len:136 (-),score=29.96 GHRQ01023673.1:784-1131(-)
MQSTVVYAPSPPLCGRCMQAVLAHASIAALHQQTIWYLQAPHWRRRCTNCMIWSRKSCNLPTLRRDEAEGVSHWELADVKANRNVKGRSLSKKQRQQRYSIPAADLQRVRIYVDF